MWFNDDKWREAANSCLQWEAEFDWILTPHEFHGLSPKFRPLEYSEVPLSGRVAFLCHKDFSDNLAAAYRQKVAEPTHYLWANEVFVLGTLEEAGEKDPAFAGHLVAWFNRLSGKVASHRAHPVFHREFVGGTGTGKKALVIGATSFGNAGDDLLGEAVAGLLLRSGEFEVVHLGGFEVRRSDLASYDAVFVGAGGLLYASQMGGLEWQNLANYFKLPFWCQERCIPCHLLAVGHQEQGVGLDRDVPTNLFLKASLEGFTHLTVRDQETAGVIRRIGRQNAVVGADPVFGFAAEIENSAQPNPEGMGLLLVGELFRYPVLSEWLSSEKGQRFLGESAGYALMSNDDLPHLARLQTLVQASGRKLEVHDFRGMKAKEIVGHIRRYEVMVGTRFHGLVLGLLAGIKPIIFDQHGGKKDRLIRSGFPELQHQLFFPESPLGALVILLEGRAKNALERAEPGKVLAHAKTVENHFPGEKVATNRPVFRLPEKKRKDLAARLLTDNGEIKVCWAAAGPGSNGYANLGDGLSAFMIANLAGLPVKHTHFDEETVRLFGVGSIGHLANRGHAVIWGTGCYRPDKMIHNVKDTIYDVLAVRGNISQECLEAVGIRAPACYGEPVWLLPSMFDEKVEKKYELGIISHISDLKTCAPDAALKEDWASFEIPDVLKASIVPITTWHEPTLEGMLDKLRLILSCKRIASRSFHGVVIAETYGIPCLPICSKPGVPHGAFASDAVKIALLDRRTLEFFNSGTRRPQYFYGQRRGRAMDWEHLIHTIDRLWSPIGYDAGPMLEAFPFNIPVDPTRGKVPLHPSVAKLVF